MDGQPHALHAYAIDSSGGPNPEIGGSPATFTCGQLPAAGVRRWIVGPADYANWGFNGFFDIQPLSAAQLDAYPRAEDFTSAPVMIRGDGRGEVYILDRGFKRHVPNPAAATNWHLDLNMVQVVPAAEVDALQPGPPLRQRPMLAQQVGDPATFVIDDPLPPREPLFNRQPREVEPQQGANPPEVFDPPAKVVPQPPLGTSKPGTNAPPAINNNDVVGGCAAAPGAPLLLLALLVRWPRRRD
jgi:hypothetical protein